MTTPEGYVPDPLWDSTFPTPDACTNGGTLDPDCVKEKRKDFDARADVQAEWKAERDAIVHREHVKKVKRAKEVGGYTDAFAATLRAHRDASLAMTNAANAVYMAKIAADYQTALQDDCCTV